MKKITALLSLALLTMSTHSMAKSDICYSKVAMLNGAKHLFLCESLGELEIKDIEKKGYKLKQLSTLPSNGKYPERIVILVSND